MAFNGGFEYPQGVEGRGAPATPESVDAALFSSSTRLRPKYQKRNWFKRRSGQGKQTQNAQQSVSDNYWHQNQVQEQYQLQQHQHQDQEFVNSVGSPAYIDYHSSNGQHPGERQLPIFPGMDVYRAQVLGEDHLSALPPPAPVLMPMSPRPLQMFDPLTVPPPLLAGYRKYRFWEEMDLALPPWEPLQPVLTPMEVENGWYLELSPPRDYRHSTLRPWAPEFVPGRLYHAVY